MITKVLLLFLQLTFVSPRHEKPVATSVWNEHCKPNTFAMNDCNMCRCGKKMQYMCDARVCNSVDLFGHFQDAIKNIDVGMEGHGVWRSTESACEPGVHYHREGLLCVCGEDGIWPNPVCRDIFRILHAVEPPPSNKDSQCSPMKLYLIGCNVCFCPSDGRFNESLCTKNPCDNDDPILELDSEKHANKTEDHIQELYAECKVEIKYHLGCRVCSCLRNNRLLCSKCPPNEEIKKKHCTDFEPLKVFNVDCNLCYCNGKGNMICSSKRCLGEGNKSTRRLMDIDPRYLQQVDPPLDDHYCRIGTKYKKGCNLCVCLENEVGAPMFACTVKSCVENASLANQATRDCVLQTAYELNCLKCMCVLANGEKWEWCETDSRCSNDEDSRRSLDTLHGYCEPLHEYKKSCNKCTCLSDGKTLVCSDDLCKEPANPVSLEIIPMVQSGNCPTGHSYKIDCNICVCLSNGNALCSTDDCDQPKISKELFV